MSNTSFSISGLARHTPHALRLGASGAAGLLALATMATPALAQEQLLSLGRPIYASSAQGGNLPDLAADGQLASRWESAWGRDPEWIYVDLGARASLTRVKLAWEGAYARAYEIQVSDDELNWQTVQRVSGNTSLENEFALAAGGRYLRVLGLERATGYGYSIRELSVYGSSPLPPAPANAALGGQVRASSDERDQPNSPPELGPRDYLAANATDGDPATRWSSAYRDGEWIQVDLGRSVQIGAVELDWQAAYGRAYDIQVSEDGANWSTVYRELSGAGGSERIALYARGRYVRMQGIARATRYGYSLFEFKVYPYREGDPRPVHALPALTQPQRVAVGKGGYETGDLFQPEPPLPRHAAAGALAPLHSNDWWQALYIRNLGGGAALVTLPLRSKYTRSGLALSALDAGRVAPDGNAINADGPTDLFVRPSGVAPGELKTRVAGHGDYSVDVVLSDDASDKMRTTLVQGSPFVYHQFGAGQRAELTSYVIGRVVDAAGNAVLLQDGASLQADHLGLEIRHPDEGAKAGATRWYGVFAPPGSVFTRIGSTIKITLGGGQRYLSMAALTAPEDLPDYYRRAYAFVTGTRVDYRYDEASREVVSTFTSRTTLQRPGFAEETLMGLLPHQWKQSAARLSARSYPSIRGAIKLLEGNSFSTVDRFLGIVPQFAEPRSPGYSRARVAAFLEQLDAEVAGNIMADDPYWQGKTLHPLAMGVLVADQIGDRVRRDRYLGLLRRALGDWLNYDPAGDRRFGTYFHYVKPWGSLVAYTSEFGLNTGLTDHHFTYGYFSFAAAVLGSYDKSFVADYGQMVDLLIRDYANPSRTDPLFSYLRNFNPYSGHSWAGGFADNPNGNNQEAAGEALFGWVGQYLWGLVTNNTAFRDAGIYGFTTELKAAEQYWFNVDRDNWHPDYPHQGVGQVYGSSYAYTTYFSGRPEHIYGIHWLPTAEYMSHYGRHRSRMGEIYGGMASAAGGAETDWQHIIWPFQSLSDPRAVLAKFDPAKLKASEAFNAYWFVHGMATLEERSGDIWASDWPAATVYRSGDGYRAQVWNPHEQARTVTFTNGSGVVGKAVVPARSTVSVDPTLTSSTPEPGAPSADPYLTREGWIASASSGGEPASNALDGLPDTRWSSGAAQTPGQYFQLDLGAAREFDTIFLSAGNSGDYPRGYAVHVSADGKTWGEPVAAGNDGAATTLISFARQKARYLRIVQTGSAGSWWSVTELRLALFGAAVELPPSAPPPAGLLDRSGWTVSASSSTARDPAQHMLDADDRSIWSSGMPQSPGQWIQVDMGKSQRLDTLTLDAGPAQGDIGRGVQLSLSEDGATWSEPVAPGAVAGDPRQIFSFAPRRARYLRLQLGGSSPNWWAVASLRAADFGGPATPLAREGLRLSAFASNGDEAPERAIDGAPGTRWSSGRTQEPGQWLEIDLGSPQSLRRLDLVSGLDDHARGLELQLSRDGQSWSTVAAQEGAGRFDTLVFPQQEARWLRLIQTGSAPRWWSIEDITLSR